MHRLEMASFSPSFVITLSTKREYPSETGRTMAMKNSEVIATEDNFRRCNIRETIRLLCNLPSLNRDCKYELPEISVDDSSLRSIVYQATVIHHHSFVKRTKRVTKFAFLIFSMILKHAQRVFYYIYIRIWKQHFHLFLYLQFDLERDEKVR